MGKECGAWVSRRLWGGGNTSPLKTTAWEAMQVHVAKQNRILGDGFSELICKNIYRILHGSAKI